MSRRVLVALQTALALALLLATVGLFPDRAQAQCASGAAQRCQQGGYLSFVRIEDGTRFRNTGECVHYANQGGFLASNAKIVVSPWPVPAGTTWANITFTGSGFIPGATLSFLLAEVPSGSVFNLTPFGADPQGGFTLPGSAWSSKVNCLVYSGSLVMTVTDQIATASVTFPTPC